MSDEALLRIALEELSRDAEARPAGAAAERPGPDPDPPRPGGSGRGKRLFMAGRLGPEVSRIRYGADARSPVAGPWDLALVVRAS